MLRNVRGISNTMLSKTLHEMESDGLLRRTEYLEVPVRVEQDTKGAAYQPVPGAFR